MISKDSKLSLRRQCELLSVNRTSIYYKPAEPDEKKNAWEEEVMREIDDIHTRMPHMWSRKIVVILTEKQYKITRRVVRHLMGKMCLCAVYPKPNLSKKDFKSAIVPYLLRNYNVIMPNQVWSIYITYIKYNRSHLYLTAIIDWFSRKIMGWTLSDTLDTSVVIRTVRDAVEKHGIPAIINSDQGVQFTSKEYKDLLKELEIRQSMDGRSRCADNIIIERWFRSFKTEEIYSNDYSSVRELKDKIAGYVNDYNTQRPHESLEYYVPDDYFYGRHLPQKTVSYQHT